MRVAVDCHMVAQRRAGDAGNGRYAVTLVHALRSHAAATDHLTALIAHSGARAVLPDGVMHATVSRLNVPRLLRDAPRMLQALGSDATVFTYVAPPRSPCPVALAVHDVTFMTHPEWLGPRARAMLRALVPGAARRAAAVLALSASAAAEVQAALGVPGDRVHVVSPGPAPVFRAVPGAAERVAARFGLRRYCLAVGDLGPRKNLGTLAAAMAALGDPDLTLALAGRPAGATAALKDARRVQLLGHVTDAELADLYAAATVTAFPSLHEGFGLPALEALACASPLVVSDRGALPEVVGDAALVVRPDVASLAEGLRAAMEPATADRLRGAGPARAATYSPRATADAAWNVLRGIAP